MAQLKDLLVAGPGRVLNDLYVQSSIYVTNGIKIGSANELKSFGTGLSLSSAGVLSASNNGTVTQIVAGTGLTGGTITTSGTIAVNFGGTGSATTVARSDHTHSYLPLSGGTMTGTLTAKANVYDDTYTGALNMANSNIYGVNAIYFADLSDSQAEGINFYRSATATDTIYAYNGKLYFVPNRTLGQNGTAYEVLTTLNYISNFQTNNPLYFDVSNKLSLKLRDGAPLQIEAEDGSLTVITGTVAGTVATGNHTHTNMVTGSGTNNYLVKWSGTNTVTNGATYDTSASNSTIAQRTANGYLYATYFNHSNSAVNIASYTVRGVNFTSSDGFIRNTSKANFLTWLGVAGVPSDGSDGDVLTWEGDTSVAGWHAPSWLPLTGGTLTKTSTGPVLIVQQTYATATTWISGIDIYATSLSPNSAATHSNFAAINFGRDSTTNMSGNLTFHYTSSSTPATNWISLGLNGNDHILNVTGNRYVGINKTAPAVPLDVLSDDASKFVGSFVCNKTLSGTTWARGVSTYASGLGVGGHFAGFEFGRTSTARNCSNFVFNYVGDGNVANNCSWGFHSVDDILVLTAQRRLGVNTTTPAYDLDVNGYINASSGITVNGTAVLTSTSALPYGNITKPSGTISTPKLLAIDPEDNNVAWLSPSDAGVNYTAVGAASSNHTHGYIQNNGSLSSSASATAATGDAIVIVDSSDSSKISYIKDLLNSTHNGQYLRRDGSWAVPPATSGVTAIRQNNGSGTEYTNVKLTFSGATINMSNNIVLVTIDGTCLMEGTKILMADRTEKNIEDVVEGDLIMSYDPNTGEMCEAIVIANLGTGVSDDFVNYYFDDGSFVTIFGKHCLYNSDMGTARGVDFWEPGWKCINSSGEEITYIGSEDITHVGRKRHFDLRSSNMLYFANGVLNANALTANNMLVKRSGFEFPQSYLDAIQEDADSSARLNTFKFDKTIGSRLVPILKELREQKKILDDNKKLLADTDYIVAKFTEGLISTVEWLKAKADRAGWRTLVNKAEEAYNTAKTRYDAFKDQYKPTSTHRERFNAAVARDNACLEALKTYYANRK